MVQSLFTWDLGLDLRRLPAVLAGWDEPRPFGRVQSTTGQIIESRGPAARLGEMVTIIVEERPGISRRTIPAQVVGFRDDRVLLMPLADPAGLTRGSIVAPARGELLVPVGPQVLGRVVDAVGIAVDGGAALSGFPRRPAGGRPPTPLERRPVDQPVRTGIAAIDTFLTCGKGQRVGIFAGSGIGKTTLLSSLVRRAAVDVCVVALIGERGREICELVSRDLDPASLARTAIVAVDAAAAPILRAKGVQTAMAIAEHFRDEGRHVLFVCDSLTRYAFALRELSLALGEPPSARGYPPSVFSAIPRLVERAGNTARGSITAFLTVLVEGDDLSEPIADAARGMLDGHIVLDRRLAERGHYPAVDVLASVSRVFDAVTGTRHRAVVRRGRRALADGRDLEEVVAMGGYTRGTDARRDRLLRRRERILAMLRSTDGQTPPDTASIEACVDRLAQVVGEPGQRRPRRPVARRPRSHGPNQGRLFGPDAGTGPGDRS